MWPDSRRFFQPASIKELRRRLLSEDEAVLHPYSPERLSPCSLTLAAGSLEVGTEPKWFKEFGDVEITVSLHRWNWLLRGLTDDPIVLSRKQGLALMRSWLSNCHSQDAFGRDPYSTGERIVNGSLFLLLTGGSAVPPDLAAAFRAMGRQVAGQLEWYHPEQTGNHALNNARALLFAGLVAKLPVAVELAFAISRERLPKLVSPDGFLREGSSHYHFLFTRWVLEMLWIAERADQQAFIQLLTPYAKLLVQRCWFFLVHNKADGGWQMPLIGDVSPDFPPDWLLGLPWSSLACDVYRPETLPMPPQQRGWKELFGVTEGTGDSCAEHTAAFPVSGWFRVDHPPWTVLVHAESQDGGMKAGHEHHDLGSFVLFRYGSPILADCGRLDYTLSPLSRYGKSAVAHNTLLIDGLGAAADGPSWLTDRYLSARVDVEVIRQAEDTVLTLAHNGFARSSKGPILHQRRLRLNGRGFWIDDQLEGKGTHRVQTRFHFAPGIELHGDTQHGWTLGEACLKFEPASFSQGVVQVGRSSVPFGGLFFPAYGCQQVSQTVDLSGTVSLPATFTYALLE